MKLVAIRMAIISVPEYNGARNPHTGQQALKNIRYDTKLTMAMVGITFGQYTLHADESDNALTFGKYTVKYNINAITTKNPPNDIRNNTLFNSSLLHNVV